MSTRSNNSRSRSGSRSNRSRTRRSRATFPDNHRDFMCSLASADKYDWQEITDRVNRRFRTSYTVYQVCASLGRMGYCLQPAS